MAEPTSIVWFRRDLRLADNPALWAACERGGPVVCVFVLPEDEPSPGTASRWWLHHALDDLGRRLARHHAPLILRAGEPARQLAAVAEETGADRLFFDRRFEPEARRAETAVEAAAAERGVEVHRSLGSLLLPPDAVETGAGGPYKVFTPYWRACLARLDPEEPLEIPRIRSPKSLPDPSPLEELRLLHGVERADGLRRSWHVGERAAHERLEHVLGDVLPEYETTRDRPDVDGTSRLSPHLHFGHLSPRQVWHAVHRETADGGSPRLIASAETFLRELGWREFAHHLLYHFPDTPTKPLRPKFDEFPWNEDASDLEPWRSGTTGFPIVDAGMRQLRETGWMHNRVRMIAASFLVKDLMLPWTAGAAWFERTLVDADLANNTLGWQWAAGCGADAAPYFRIFNPVKQGQRYDPDGTYVRRYVPELAELPDRWIHRPWDAPADVLEDGDVELGTTYPEPMVDHGEARRRALAAFETITASGGANSEE